MKSLRQSGSGMFSAYADRCQPKSVFLAIERNSMSMTSMRQTGFGMISTCADRCLPKSNFLSLLSLFLVLVSTGLLSGCATVCPKINSPADLRTLLPDEVIVAARFRIMCNGKDVTKACNVKFDAYGFIDFPCMLDETGYVFAKFPVGKHWVNTIRIAASTQVDAYAFCEKDITFQVIGGSAVTYIGDITVDWRPSTGTALSKNGPAYALGASLWTPKTINVSVKADADAAQRAFREKFQTDRAFTLSLCTPASYHYEEPRPWSLYGGKEDK